MYPVLFKFGSIEIRLYGVMIALAFIVGTLIGEREARRKGFPPGTVYDLLSFMLIAVVIGARLYYVIFSDLSWFITHPFEIIAIWKGGLSLHGGMIGGLIAGIWYCRKRGLPVWKFSDVLAPSAIIGQAIGRIGCTLNGCCYGKETDLPWGLVYSDPHSSAPLGIPLHPTQIYEIILSLILFAGIWYSRKKVSFDGQMFLTYIMGYGIIRFFLEFFRGDSLLLFNLIPVPHAMSTVVFLTGLILYIYRKKSGSVASSEPLNKQIKVKGKKSEARS
jgi:phosphatidylglycerol:prolipoprotein diacylglycerol transferase